MLMYTVEYFNRKTDRLECTHIIASCSNEAIANCWNASRFSDTVDILCVSDIGVIGYKQITWKPGK